MDWIKLLDLTGGVAGIVGVIIVCKIFMKFMGNHMSESTRSNERLANAIETMLRFLEKKKD